MPDKKSALSKPASKAAPAKKAPPPARREPASKKEPPKPVKAKANGKAAPAPKAPAATKASPAKTAKAPPAKPAAKKVEAKPVAKPAAKVEAKGKAAAKVETKTAKPAAKTAPEPKTAKPAAKAKVAAEPKAAKPAPAPKPEKPPKAAKVPKEKPPKPPKLAPVAAALAKPMPAKPLAVAAGRAQPILRSVPTPAPKVAPKPLVAPKPAAAEPETAGEAQAVPAFKAKSPASKGMIMVGAIAGAFGVKGEVRLRAFTEKNEGVISYGPLYGEDGKVLLKPKSWRALKDGVAVLTAEVKSREEAEKMRGQKLFVPRANLPSPAPDEFYVVDLLGSRAEALDGTVLGDIIAVWNFGAGDILEYRPPDGSPNVRVTFTKETVPHVDLPAKRVVIDPPAPEPVGK